MAETIWLQQQIAVSLSQPDERSLPGPQFFALGDLTQLVANCLHSGSVQSNSILFTKSPKHMHVRSAGRSTTGHKCKVYKKLRSLEYSIKNV